MLFFSLFSFLSSPLQWLTSSSPLFLFIPSVTNMGLNSSVSVIGLETSNLGPNLYRDGGGGAIINGLNIVWYSDGIWTKGGAPTAGLDNWLNFSSNSITVSSYQGAGINNMFDFGTTDKGPNQQVPFFYESGEGDNSHGIWPNQNLVTLCGGGCAVGFPEVVDRRTEDGASLLYNTAVRIEFNAYGPVVTRPVKALFNAGEPTYGSFCSHNGLDGYIYMYAKITQTSGSNGLKLARVPNTQYHQRSEYQYWDGNAWVGQIPAYDNADANTFSWSQNQFGTYYGPGYGDVFWSDISNTYVMLFQSGAPALDDNRMYYCLCIFKEQCMY